MDLIKLLELLLQFTKRVYYWIQLRLKWHGNTELVRKIAFAFNSYSWRYLQQKFPTIHKIGYIERPEIQDIYNYWNYSDEPIMLFGEAGSGKSGIAFRLGEALTKEGTPVLFIKATDFPSDQDPVLDLSSLLALPIPLFDAFVALGALRPCVLIVDQLDGIAGMELCKKLINFVNLLSGVKNIKILVVSRSYEYRNDPEISNINFKGIECGRITNEQAREYLYRLGIQEPSNKLSEISHNLLNLSIIAELVEDPHVIIGDITDEVKLWKKYYSTIQKYEGDDLTEFILSLARKVTSREEHTFSVEFPNPRIRRRLLSLNILHEIYRNKYVFRHEQLRDFLCAYSIMPDQPKLHQIINEFGFNTSKNVILWLHRLIHNDIPNNEPGFIDEVLSAKEVLPYYSRIVVIENLRNQNNPSVGTALIIQRYFDVNAYQSYLFKDLHNPSWIIPLYETGFFKHLPGPNEVQPGSFQMPDWHAGKYLVKFADRFEDIVVDTIKSCQTENWRVQEILIDAMIKISPARSAELVEVVDSWLNGRFSNWLPMKLNTLSDYLFENGYVLAAIKIFEYVISPALTPSPNEYSEYYSRIHYRSDHYAVKDYVEKQMAKLTQINPLEMALTFERQIKEAIALTKKWKSDEAEELVGFKWRLYIPTYLDGQDETNALDTLIDGLRDSLLEVCKTTIDDGGKLLENYLNSEHVILKRIALYTLRQYGKNYPRLLEDALLNRDNLEYSKFAKEYRGLLRDQFGNVSDSTRAKVISWILSGPLDVESRLHWITEWEKREPTDNDRERVREEWIHSHLGIVESFLSGKALIIYDQLTSKYGKPDISERPRFVVSSVEETPSPIATEELGKMNFYELKNLFLTFTPNDLFLNPRESLGRDFHRLINENPAKFLEFASYLNDPNIRFIYIYQYLSGIQEGVRNKGINITDELINLCDYVVNKEEDPFIETTADHEPGLLSAQMEAARLLEYSLRSDDPYLTRDQLDQIRSIIIKLAHHQNPDMVADSETSFNPFNFSFNCVRGIALHGIFQYSLYVVRKDNKETGRENRFLEPEIREFLDIKLDLSVEPSLAVHSVFGASLTKLYFLDKDWLIHHLPDIFPQDESLSAYWKAAWGGYIFYNNVHGEIFKILSKYYQRALVLLSQSKVEEKNIGGSPDERFAQHIMFAYLNDLTNFDHENQILDLFFNHAPDVMRAQGILWLSQVIEHHKPSIDDPLWQKCWILWNKRISFVEGDGIKENSHEISEYLRWLKNCPQDLGDLYDILMKSTKYLHDSYDVKLVTEFLTKYCNQSPFEAIAILQLVIINAKEPWWTPKEEVEEKILIAAMTSNIKEARRIAIELINYHGEQGDFRWRTLLDL